MRGIKPDVRAVALLLPLLLTSCAHKKNQAQIQPPLAPPIEDTPPPAPSKAPTNLPPSVITVPQSQQPPKPAPSTAAQTQPPPKPAHRRHKPSPAKPAPTPSNTEQAANGSPEVSAIGQLSSGDSSDLGRQTSNSIADTEQKLDKIHRRLNDTEQKTVAQIREFLKQARAALTSGDSDGAYTLALKAKVLLGELVQ